jgi:hypothetical protein
MRRRLGIGIGIGIGLGLGGCGGTAPAGIPPPAIVRASDVVEPGDAWDDVYPRLVDRLGLPTRVDGDSYAWASRHGNDCYLIEVRVDDGVIVFVDSPYRDTPRGDDPFARCTRAAP